MNTLNAFHTALTDPALPVPDGITSARGEPDPLRFAVYRNNVHVSLVEALKKAFRVTHRVVGEAFFVAMARAFVAHHKPASPVLMTYGETFPAFIAGFAPAASLPYLPDLASLEYAWTRSYHARDAGAFAVADLAHVAPDALGAIVLDPHPAAQLIQSRFPVGTIWSANQGQTDQRLITSGAEAVLITRPRFEVHVTILPPADAAFLAALLAGRALEQAAELALHADKTFDFGRALTGLSGLGAFAQRFQGDRP